MTVHFFVIIEEPSRRLAVRRLRVERGLQRELTGVFAEQAQHFLSLDLERIPYDGRYQVDSSELFIIDRFPLPSNVKDAVARPRSCEDLQLNDGDLPKIKALMGGRVERESDAVTVWFQAFDRSHFLMPGRTLLLQTGTFQRISEPGLTVADKLSAVFHEGQLAFRSHAVVTRFLDLGAFRPEATDAQIRDVLEHERIMANPDRIVRISDRWMRRRFSMLLDSEILDHMSPRQIADEGNRFGIEVRLVKTRDGNERLVIPDDKRQAKALMKLLNEELFRGPLSARLYQTNSKRPL